MNRREARRAALQILYQLDVNRDARPTAALYQFEKHFAEQLGERGNVLDPFTQELVSGVNEHREELDRFLDAQATGWKVGRMAAVDRNILRLGVFELRFRSEIPATVTINEMVELAKEFGSEQSASFVNGILDALKGRLVPEKKAP